MPPRPTAPLRAGLVLALLLGAAGCSSDDGAPGSPVAGTGGATATSARTPRSGDVAPVPPAPTTAASVPLAARWCAAAAPVAAGTVADPDLAELSGLAASRTQPGVLWAIADSGNAPHVVALDPTGATLATVRVRGVRNVDWEDVAVLPGTAGAPDRIVVADTGDNRSRRASVALVVLDEPAVPERGASPAVLDADAEVWPLTWPGGARDAEALLVDADGSLHVVAKELFGDAVVARVPAGAGPAAPALLEEEGTISTGLGRPVTAGVVSPDGTGVLLRTYDAVLAYARPAGTTLVAALGAGRPCEAPAPDEPQGEAIALRADGGYVTGSERGQGGGVQPLWAVALR